VQADKPGAAKFDHVESCESEEGKEAIEGFWLRAVDSRCEGLMIKVRGYISIQISFFRPTHQKYFESFWTTAKFWKPRVRGRTPPGNIHYLQPMNLVRPCKYFIYGVVSSFSHQSLQQTKERQRG
jgi:hypothetical protein